MAHLLCIVEEVHDWTQGIQTAGKAKAARAARQAVRQRQAKEQEPDVST